MSRFDLFDLIVVDIERCFDSGFFRSYYYDFIICIVVGRTDTIGIANNKSRARSGQAGHGITTVKIFTGALQYTLKINLIFNDVSYLAIAVAIFVFFKETLNFFVEEVSDLLHHGYCIDFLFGVLTKIDKNVKQFFNVGHVEIPGHYQVTTSPVILTKERMDVLNTINTVSAVAKVTQPKFTGESNILFEPVFVSEFILPGLLRFPVFFSDFLKEVGYWLGFYRAISADVSVAWFNVDFDVGNTCAVLAPVMLFFHEDVHPVHGIGWAVLFNII